MKIELPSGTLELNDWEAKVVLAELKAYFSEKDSKEIRPSFVYREPVRYVTPQYAEPVRYEPMQPSYRPPNIYCGIAGEPQ
jgi:hypothetical protein